MTHPIFASTLFAFSTVVFVSSSAVAGVDADAAKALAKRNDCFKCHAIDKTKKGPSYKNIAAKFKGKAEGEEKLIKHFTAGETHMIIDTKDMKEMKNLAQWILSLDK